MEWGNQKIIENAPVNLLFCIDFYRNNPESYAIVYGTDLAQEYLNDLINLFNEQ